MVCRRYTGGHKEFEDKTKNLLKMKKLAYLFLMSILSVFVACQNQNNNRIEGVEGSDTADLITPDMLYDGEIVYDSMTDKNLLDIMLAILNNDKSDVASRVLYPLDRVYPLKDIKDSAQMENYFSVIFDDSIKNVLRNMTVRSWDFHNYKGITFANGEYIWTEGSRITGINYYSEREQSMLDGLRKQEIASLDKSLQGDWFPVMCLRDINDGTIFRVDSHNSDYSDNYGDEIRMAIYDEGKDLHGKPSRVLMGVYHIEGSFPSFYMYCSSHLDMVWLSVNLNYSEDCEAYRMKYYEQGSETERTVDDCYWLDLLK